MLATVHAAGSSLLGLFSSCTTFDSTDFCLFYYSIALSLCRLLSEQQHFTKEENRAYIDTEFDYHYFQNKKINNERFLDSWEIITQHCDTNKVLFQSNKHNKPMPPPGEVRNKSKSQPMVNTSYI